MARRSRKKKEVDLIEGLAGFGLVTSLLLGYMLTGSLIGAGVIAGCVLGLIIVVFVLLRVQREEKLKKSGIRDIDKMDGIQFEHYLKHIFTLEVT